MRVKVPLSVVIAAALCASASALAVSPSDGMDRADKRIPVRGHGNPPTDNANPAPERSLREIAINENMLAVATLEQYGKGRKASKVISARGGGFVKLFFSAVRLPTGAYLRVSDLKNTQVHLYGHADFESAFSVNGRVFMPASIIGDGAVVSVIYPKGVVPTGSDAVHIDRFVTRQVSAQKGVIGGIDERVSAVCLMPIRPDFFLRSQSVANVANFYESAEGTGWALGTGNRLVTNAHLVGASDAPYMEAWFNYASDTCNPSNDPKYPVVLEGETTLFNDFTVGIPESDFTVLSLREFDFENAKIKQLFGGLELARSGEDVAAEEPVYAPQHGGGLPRQIAYLKAGTPCIGTWFSQGAWSVPTSESNCDATKGSSGSPMLSQRSHKVVGMLAYEESNFNYGPAAHYMWDHLQELIPDNENVMREGSNDVRTSDVSLIDGGQEVSVMMYDRNVTFQSIDVPMMHFRDHSSIVVNSRNVVTGKVAPVTYRLWVDTACGRMNLGTSCGISHSTNLNAVYFREDNPGVDSDAVLTSWLPLAVRSQLPPESLGHLLAKVRVGDRIE